MLRTTRDRGEVQSHDPLRPEVTRHIKEDPTENIPGETSLVYSRGHREHHFNSVGSA